ncbi:MAG: RlpA-like double-psi beta-barrel domain-containing protein [Patescibacteria group bacterium]|jgi:D-alanyl-D-alanine endopeptidase (penicillin-binding protein 7)
MTDKLRHLIIPPLFFLLAVVFGVPGSVQAALDSALSISYSELAFTAPVTLSISQSAETANLPWEWEALTAAYDYSFATAGFYDPSRPLNIKISYPEKNNYFKQIFSYDSSAHVWRPLLTHDNPAQQYVTATTDATAGRLIVLADPELMTVGTASWYKYKNGLFAASPDFIKGTVLRVHNLDNGKFVDVTINDFGPERDKHPDRVIDLDKVAFAKIASTGAGLINVKVEPLKIIIPDLKRSVPQTTSDLNLTASSAVIVLEKDGSILWGKNEKQVSPLASLTKLVAAKVFLDTNPTLSQVVTYKTQDEKYNYAYCKPWESAKLTVKEGETLTISDLLYSALVGSANNAVESLVRVSGLKRADFIAKMNKTVKVWGATGTSFVEPTGLSPDNVSSPYDYAIITKEVFSNPLIKKISTASSYTFKTVNTKKSHTLKNTNKLLTSKTYNIIGSKTGYLDEARYCLMTRVATAQGNLIAVNFGSTSSAANFFDNEQLIRYGLKLLKK